MTFSTVVSIPKASIPRIGVTGSHFRRLGSNEMMSTDSIINMLLAVGAKCYRFDLFWQDCEQTSGVYAWPAHIVDLVNKLVANDIRPYMILARGNSLHTGGWDKPPVTAAARTAYANFADAALVKFGAVTRYIISNEPNNYGMWGAIPNAEDYGRLVAETATKMRARVPGVWLFAGELAIGGGVGADFIDPKTFLSGMLPYIDLNKITGVSMHPYTGADQYVQNDPMMLPESVRARTFGIRPASPNPGSNMHIFNTEQGFSSVHCNGGTQQEKLDRQAVYAARFVLSSLQLNISSIWYNLVDRGTEQSDVEQTFGLFDYGYAIKPAGRAFGAVMQLVNTADSIVLSKDGSLWQAEFKYTGATSKQVQWYSTGSGAVQYPLAETDAPRVIQTV